MRAAHKERCELGLIQMLTDWDDYQVVMELMRYRLMPEDIDNWFIQ